MENYLLLLKTTMEMQQGLFMELIAAICIGDLCQQTRNIYWTYVSYVLRTNPA